MKHSRAHLSGILFMVYGSFAFSIMSFCVKWASETLPSLEIVFFRSLIGTILFAQLMIRKKVSFLGTNRKILFFRGVSGFIALALFFYTLEHIELGTAVMLNYLAPIISALYAVIFLKERPSFFLIVMFALCFVGVALLIDGKFDAWNIYIFTGLLSAFFAGIAYVVIRAIKHRESPLTIIFYFVLTSTIGSAFFLPFGFKWPNLTEWLLLAGVSAGAFYGQLGITIALRRAPASLVGPFAYLTPLLTFIYGLIFWNETLGLRSLAGAALIILSGCLISYLSSRKKLIR